MKLTYIYHSGFCIETDEATIIIDFYKDTKDRGGLIYKEILPNAKKLYVLSTHSHLDHFSGEIFNWKKTNDDITYILSKDILDKGMTKNEDAYYLDKLEEYRDDHIYVKAFGSTDVGHSFYIEIAGKKIFHAGDLNNWHWNEESTPAEIKEAEDFFDKELNILTNEVKELDLAMFPIDPRLGKDYMKGAQQFIGKINVANLAPMHFDEEYAKMEAFESIAKKENCKYLVLKEKGQSFNL